MHISEMVTYIRIIVWCLYWSLVPIWCSQFPGVSHPRTQTELSSATTTPRGKHSYIGQSFPN